VLEEVLDGVALLLDELVEDAVFVASDVEVEELDDVEEDDCEDEEVCVEDELQDTK
jgi:hypothetical protein